MSDQNMSGALIEARDISKKYSEGKNQLCIFEHVNFEIFEGQSVGIVGSSGAGKTTLLNILGGLDAASDGDVKIAGHDISSCSDSVLTRLRNQYLGFVYQFHHLLAEFSAEENVAMPLYIAGISKKEAKSRALDLLSKVGLSERAKHKPSELSGGERQRVAIARALANEPQCVLMDEPTGNLDEATARSIQDLMVELQTNLKTAFIVVTHDLQLASRMDKTLIMEDGHLREQNT